MEFAFANSFSTIFLRGNNINLFLQINFVGLVGWCCFCCCCWIKLKIDWIHTFEVPSTHAIISYLFGRNLSEMVSVFMVIQHFLLPFRDYTQINNAWQLEATGNGKYKKKIIINNKIAPEERKKLCSLVERHLSFTSTHQIFYFMKIVPAITNVW